MKVVTQFKSDHNMLYTEMLPVPKLKAHSQPDLCVLKGCSASSSHHLQLLTPVPS